MRRAMVGWYEAQRARDGERTCARMTAAARTFYAEGFGGGRPCETVFGPRGTPLFSVGAPFALGLYAQATVTVRGDRAIARALDEQQVLRRVGGRWLVDAP